MQMPVNQYSGSAPDFRTMASAMQSLSGNPAGMTEPGTPPYPMLSGQGPITPSQTTRGSMANAGVGSTGGDMANTANQTGDGGSTMQLVQLVQMLSAQLGRPPTREEIIAVIRQMQGSTGNPGAMDMQMPSGMPPVAVTPPPTTLRRP
jgi:hypothetical protein